MSLAGRSVLGQLLCLLDDTLSQTPVRACLQKADYLLKLLELHQQLTDLNIWPAGTVSDDWSRRGDNDSEVWLTLSNLLQVPFILAVLPRQCETWAFWALICVQAESISVLESAKLVTARGLRDGSWIFHA